MNNSIQEKEAMTSFVEKILVSILMLTMGILFCVNVSAAVSITIGVILCVYGVINLIIIGISRRPMIGAMGVLNGAIIAVGIAFCTHDLATVVVLLIPFVLTILGALMIIDGAICYFSLKQGGFLRFAILEVAGACSFSLGLCQLCLEDFRLGYSEMIFGIMLCVGSVALLTYTLVAKFKKKGE